MKDIHVAITERFLEQLRKGCVPWQRPWTGAQNLVSKKSYRGINSLTLGLAAYSSPFWLTFRQANELGGRIRQGEKSSPVIYYKFIEKRDASGKPVMTKKGRPAFIPFVRWSNVFNLEQTEGISAPALPKVPESAPLERAEALMSKAPICPIRTEGFAAAYSPREDIIRMPQRSLFRSPEDYHHVLFHESIHATGHASRLAREGIIDPIKFGSDKYSKEELIAELGASFLSNEAGILDQVLFENSASYLQSWARNLEKDPALLISAASQAQRGFDWMMGIRYEEQESLSESEDTAKALVPEFRQPTEDSLPAARPTHGFRR